MITSRRRLSRENMEHPQAFLDPGELMRERSSAMLRLIGGAIGVTRYQRFLGRRG
jgi:hypothetical protein